jgi:hypothetical protein
MEKLKKDILFFYLSLEGKEKQRDFIEVNLQIGNKSRNAIFDYNSLELKAILEKVPDSTLHTEKLDRYKELIKNGNYKTNSHVIIKKILGIV